MSPDLSIHTAVLIGAAAVFGGSSALAHPATIYSQPALQSPVRADPDDLLLLPGYGFTAHDTVVYERVDDTTRPAETPATVPLTSNADLGTAPVASFRNVPYSLTVRLPMTLRAGQTYRLWVRNAAGEWSNGVLINDARPLWFTPSAVYSTADCAGLDRRIKIGGRNLEAAAGSVARARLVGPARIELPVESVESDGPDVQRYAAVIHLPGHLPVGRYRIEINRDGHSWVAVPGERLQVNADPPAARRFDIAAKSNGGCRPDDGLDDTRCIARAIAAASAARGGAVVLGAGTWDLVDADHAGVVRGDGIVLPPGVQLIGAGRRRTKIVRHDAWNSGAANFTFTLSGHNSVQVILFDAQHQSRPREAPRPGLHLGRRHQPAGPHGADRAPVRDVIVTDDDFDRVYEAIVDSGLPIERLYVTHNQFAAYYVDLEMPGNRFDVDMPYRIDDSVIAYNRFDPSGFVDLQRQTGVLASEIGAARRLDFSHNVADGSSSVHLNSPRDPKGWRAGFFWNLNGNQEMLLVSDNRATCTGDLIGDGEAIAYDNNGNTFGFNGVQTVVRSSATQITLPGPLSARQNDRRVDVSSYYVGHWIQIAEGPGLGEARKIRAYRIDPASGQVTFVVAPAWDVLPAAGTSRAGIAREYWQTYTVGNVVDQRRPPCLKSNRSRDKGGVIALWAQTADSVVEGNRQYDTDGILLQQGFSAADRGCPTCSSWTFFQYFVEIRDNTIDGEYRWNSACSQSGIFGSYVASPSLAEPPVLSYGVSVSRNRIIRADALGGGAIDFASTWYRGPPPYRWQLVSNLLIDHNEIAHIDGPPPSDGCGLHQTGRIGIRIDGPGEVWRSVLYANRCARVATKLRDLGSETVRVCSADAPPESCECPATD